MLAWLVLKAPGTVNSDHQPVTIDFLAVDSFGRSALHEAAAANNYQAIDLLFKASSDLNVDAKDCFGLSPLHAAAKVNGLKSVSLLLSKGANADLRDMCARRPVELATKDSVIRLLAQALQAGARSLQPPRGG